MKVVVRDEVAERRRGSRCCGVAPRKLLDGEAAERLTGDLLALAHPVRLQILDILARRGGEVCVCDLEAALPVKQPTVSHHLRLLREAGLVDTVRKGLWAYYLVRPEALSALKARVGKALDSLG
jgi:ArsR family transcriptional regulator